MKKLQKKNIKKRIPIIVVTILIVILFIITLTNKTFFKNYYEIESNKRIPLPIFSYYEKEDNNNITFNTFRRVDNVSSIINSYIENLHSCYDESYFYDSDLNITISKYYVEDKFPFNKIHLAFTTGNYCENEYVLEDNWINDIKDKIEDISIEKCVIQNSNINCDSKNIKELDINELLNYISKDSRIENKDNISIKIDEDYYSISSYYSINNNSYTLSIFKYNNYLAFKITDANDHSKNAIYNIDKDINKLFNNIYNKY
jgi:hypothetical protein